MIKKYGNIIKFIYVIERKISWKFNILNLENNRKNNSEFRYS